LHVEAWVKGMTATLAPTTIDTRFTIVRGVFRAAVADRLIASDPTVGVVLPRKRKAEAAMSIPTNTDVAKLLNAAEPERRPQSRPGFTAYVALCAFAGLRRGEALGVQVSDVDFLACTLRVTRELQRAKLADIDPGKDRVEAAGGITVMIRSPSPKYDAVAPPGGGLSRTRPAQTGAS
jgi:integrase